MDLIRVIYRLRPDVTWLNDTVNAHSKYTLQKTYQSSQPFPSDAEGIAAWAEIQAEDAAKLQEDADLEDAQENSGYRNVTVDQAGSYLTTEITKLNTLSVSERTILRDVLLKMAVMIIKRTGE